MKRIVMILSVATLFMITAVGAFAAQAGGAYRSGAIVAQAGIGFGFPGQAGTTTIPPIIASVEYQIEVAPHVPLSFGAVAGYAASKYSFSDSLGDTFD